MLTYVLAYRPDEFGLVPSEEGFVRYKELLKALHEEEGWRHVRQSHINEMLMGEDRTLFETEGDRMRSRKRHWVMDAQSDHPLPGLLYTPVRKRAHPVAMEKGLKAETGSRIALSPHREMALRMGRRRDQNPVLLEIPATLAEKKGMRIFSFGVLFLTPEIPAHCISGPLPPKDLLEKAEKKGGKQPKKRFGSQTPDARFLYSGPSKRSGSVKKSKRKKTKGVERSGQKNA